LWVSVAVNADGAVTFIGLSPQSQQNAQQLAHRVGVTLVPSTSAHLDAVFAQLFEYLDGSRRAFDLPLAVHGTSFQRRAWEALGTIAYGEIRTYGQQAAALGQPKAARAVGRANAANAIAILVPCHRVIGSGGGLTGFAAGVGIKRMLLELEGSCTAAKLDEQAVVDRQLALPRV
jgi:O-6-methylguanine DNA methyltransferase